MLLHLGQIVGDLEKYKSHGLGTVHLKNLTYDIETAYHFEKLNWNGCYDQALLEVITVNN